MANTPNFFIVGAPKCGTTSLSRYLTEHPDIFFSHPKEPLFFGSDLDHKWKKFDLDQYISLFDEASTEKCIGEGSVWNLYSEKAAEEIKAFEPDAKIIVMLRDPVGLISSLHRQFLVSGNETIRDCDEALAAEPARREGEKISRRAHFPAGLLYTDVARFADQVERYLNAFDRDRVHIILYDDLKEDTESVYDDVLQFLEVDDSFTPDLAVHGKGNQKQTTQSGAIDSLLNSPPRFLDRTYGMIPRPVRSFARKKISRWNYRKVERTDISAEMAANVKSKLHEEFERLSEVIDRDVTDWTA